MGQLMKHEIALAVMTLVWEVEIKLKENDVEGLKKLLDEYRKHYLPDYLFGRKQWQRTISKDK